MIGMSLAIDENKQKKKQQTINVKLSNGLKRIVPLQRDHLDEFPW
jgi:hypothetical protein